MTSHNFAVHILKTYMATGKHGCILLAANWYTEDHVWCADSSVSDDPQQGRVGQWRA